MLLVDHDQPQVAERQEQGRAGADHDAAAAGGHRLPDPAPRGRGDAGVPFGRAAAPKRSSNRAITAWVRAISGSRISTWAVGIGGQGRGDGLQIDLGLARAGDPVEQGGLEAALGRPWPSAPRRRRPGWGSAPAPGAAGSGAAKAARAARSATCQHALVDQRP